MLKNFVEKHFKKAFQFCLVGSLGAIVNLIAQYILVMYFKIHFISAAMLGIFAAMLFNYFLNYYWTFGGINLYMMKIPPLRRYPALRLNL